MTRYPVIAVLAFLTGTTSGAIAQGLTDDLVVAAITDSVVADLLNFPPPVAGAAIAVNRGGRRIVHRVAGLVNAPAQQSLDAAAPLRIGSITKQFTAVAVLQLVERGRIRLDVPIQEYMPGFDTQGHTVTVRHLLNHTSGLPSLAAIYRGTGTGPIPRATMLDTLQTHPYDFSPGERFRYNNAGYILLGMIIEQITARTYAHHLDETLFAPLGLESTGYCGHGGEQIPTGHRVAEDRLETVVLPNGDYLGGSGGLCSTAGDLVDWLDALATGRVISPEHYEMMLTPTVLASGETVSYGFGVRLERLEGEAIVAHGGAVDGFNSRLAYYPGHNLAVAVLVNTSTPRARAVEQAVARAALGMSQLVRTDLPLSDVERARYVGTYDLAGREFRVFAAGDKLLAEPAGQSIARLLNQGDHVFLPDVGPEIRIEFHVENDRATSLTLHQGGRQIAASRIAR